MLLFKFSIPSANCPTWIYSAPRLLNAQEFFGAARLAARKAAIAS